MRGHSLRLSSTPSSTDDSPGEYPFVVVEPTQDGSTIAAGERGLDNIDFEMLHAPTVTTAKHGTYHAHHSHSHSHFHQSHGADPHNSRRVLGTLSVVAITFFFGCGGPLGSEPVISSAGPLIALISLIVYPILFTYPFGAVVAELSTAFPEDGGFPIAVKNAFGHFWGVQVGYLSWVGNIMSTAIYPALVVDLLIAQGVLSETLSSTATYLAKAAIALVLTVPCLLGTAFISRSMVLLLTVVWTCVVVYVIWASTQADSYSQLGQVLRSETEYNPETGLVESSSGEVQIAWFDLLNTLFWNYDGVQMASVFGGRVSIPARVYPRAIKITITLTVLCYLLPLPVTIATKYINWKLFEEDSYGQVAAIQIGGKFLQGVMVVLNFATSIGMFISSTFCEATEIAGMAQSGMIHPVVGRVTRHTASPHVAIAVATLPMLVLLAFDTEFLIPVTNAFACLVTIIIFLSGVQLRRKFPHFPRPSTVPAGPMAMVGISVVPIGVCMVLLCHTLTESWSQCGMVMGFVACGLVLSGLEKWREQHAIGGY